MVWGSRVANIVMSFKSLKEFLQNVILSFFALNDIWMSLAVVYSSNVIDVYLATSILVNSLESLSY